MLGQGGLKQLNKKSPPQSAKLDPWNLMNFGSKRPFQDILARLNLRLWFLNMFILRHKKFLILLDFA
jgi:hypothetical protein